jgi:hypothetical protein
MNPLRMVATLTIVVVVVVFAVAETVGAAETALRVIGRKSASGDYAIALASGRAKKPTALYMRVITHPNQHVTANWTMVCSKGFGAGSKSGSFAHRTPVTRRMRMPMTRPDDCTVSGTAQLGRSGRIIVLLLKRP